MASSKEEKTLVLVKPDGVKRGIVGDIISRMERVGLKIVALKALHITKSFAKSHYPGTDDHCCGMGNKTLENYQKYNKDARKELGTNDPLKIGKMIEQWNIEYLTSGPVIAMIVQGLHAVDMVRKMAGHTLPAKADMGTIRGDYSIDSPTLANEGKRAIRNIIHASGKAEEADREIKLWFKPTEICSYSRSDEDIMF